MSLNDKVVNESVETTLQTYGVLQTLTKSMFARDKNILLKTLRILSLLTYNKQLSDELASMNVISTMLNLIS